MVRECGDTNLWTVERLGPARRHVDDDEVMVHVFGSTPIVTRSSHSSMRFAMYCHKNRPPCELRWIKTTPNNKQVAIEGIARKRQINEAIFATRAVGNLA